jgi:mycobactin lysine-N-oxygenase
MIATRDTAPSKLLVLVGAGPKAAALAAKARVLKQLGMMIHGETKILVIERQAEIASNWVGSCGFTTGDVELCTPPEKDVGFPYTSVYGSAVDRMMLQQYSWHAYKILFDRSSYSDWIDTDRHHPTHAEWARYIANTLKSAMTEDEPDRQPEGDSDLIRILTSTTVTSVAPENGKVLITATDERGVLPDILADGIVFTGPGEPITIEKTPPGVLDHVYDSRSYWQRIADFVKMDSGTTAVIGGGESAASVVTSLLELTRRNSLEIDIINRHGAVFTRGESYSESVRFSNPNNWAEWEEADRIEFIRRTDRGVFSAAAQKLLKRARSVRFKAGEVFQLEPVGSQVRVHYRRGQPSATSSKLYDKVIVALGFNPWVMLDMFPPAFRPTFASPEELRAHYGKLERSVDRNLIMKFDYVPGMRDQTFNVHTPVVAGLAQGPGFPSLCCLGHLSDRILKSYI